MTTIMIVDDSTSIRQMLNMVLKTAGYQVIEAIDGQDALRQLNGQPVHLIVADINMPKMDGITLIREVKLRPGYQQVPFLMLTTEGAEQAKEQGRQAGARAWIVKPFRPEQLLLVVGKLLAA